MEMLRYTPLDEAAELLGERRNNEELQAKLDEYLGGNVPDGPFALGAACPVSVLAEYVARPTNRDIDFARTSIDTGFGPWWLTYEADQFVSGNQKKVEMIRPPLALPNRLDLNKKCIVPPGQRGGAIGSMPTVFEAMPTVGVFWQAARAIVLPRVGLESVQDNTFDIGDWYRQQAERFGTRSKNKLADGYYPAVMGLYAARAALFLNFEVYPGFRDQIALPAFNQTAAALGVDPIIVAWSPQKEAAAISKRSADRMVKYNQTDLTFVDITLASKKEDQQPLLDQIGEILAKGVSDEPS